MPTRQVAKIPWAQGPQQCPVQRCTDGSLRMPGLCLGSAPTAADPTGWNHCTLQQSASGLCLPPQQVEPPALEASRGISQTFPSELPETPGQGTQLCPASLCPEGAVGWASALPGDAVCCTPGWIPSPSAKAGDVKVGQANYQSISTHALLEVRELSPGCR